jgi:predicted Ser/Thr protein kinase
MKFVFRIDAANVTNHVTFGNNAQNNQITANVNSATFGTLQFASADPRAFQFSGKLTF